MDVARKKRWYLQSVIDPRWNVVGEGLATRFDTPDEALEAIKNFEQKYGDKPNDLKFGYY